MRFYDVNDPSEIQFVGDINPADVNWIDRGTHWTATYKFQGQELFLKAYPPLHVVRTPAPALAWDRDNLADALEAIETHPRVDRIRTAIASVTRLVTTQNIDVMAPELEALASALEAVKDAVALELNLAWTRRPK